MSFIRLPQPSNPPLSYPRQFNSLLPFLTSFSHSTHDLRAHFSEPFSRVSCPPPVSLLFPCTVSFYMSRAVVGNPALLAAYIFPGTPICPHHVMRLRKRTLLIFSLLHTLRPFSSRLNKRALVFPLRTPARFILHLKGENSASIIKEHLPSFDVYTPPP